MGSEPQQGRVRGYCACANGAAEGQRIEHRRLRLGTREQIYILDALELVDLEPLQALLGDPEVIKIIHNASFEKSVLRRYGVEIANIVDTLKLSRLAAALRRQRDRGRAQARRGLSARAGDRARQERADQIAYAALDVEVLPPLWDRLQQQARLL